MVWLFYLQIYITVQQIYIIQDYITQAATSKKRSISAETCVGVYLIYFSGFFVKGIVQYLQTQITQIISTYIIILWCYLPASCPRSKKVYLAWLLNWHASIVEELPNMTGILCYKKDGQCTYNVNTEVSLYNHCCHGKAISIAYTEYVSVALVMQHLKYMRCIIL